MTIRDGIPNRYVVECWNRHSTAKHEQPARTLI